jgi:hypothetical protein
MKKDNSKKDTKKKAAPITPPVRIDKVARTKANKARRMAKDAKLKASKQFAHSSHAIPVSGKVRNIYRFSANLKVKATEHDIKAAREAKARKFEVAKLAKTLYSLQERARVHG